MNKDQREYLEKAIMDFGGVAKFAREMQKKGFEKTSRMSIYNWIRGKHSINSDRLRIVCQILKIDPKKLF